MLCVDKSVSSALAYTSRPYSEAMAMRPAVTYTLYATSLKEQTSDVIMFTNFEEGNILTETRNDAESGDKSDNESIMMIKHDMDSMNSGDGSDHDLISTEMLEDIRDGGKTIQTLTEEKHVINYAIVLGQDNRNVKER